MDPAILVAGVVGIILGSFLLPITTGIVGNLLTPRVNTGLERLADWTRDRSLKRLREEYRVTKHWHENQDQFLLHILRRLAAGIPQFSDPHLSRRIEDVMGFEDFEKRTLARIEELERHLADKGRSG